MNVDDNSEHLTPRFLPTTITRASPLLQRPLYRKRRKSLDTRMKSALRILVGVAVFGGFSVLLMLFNNHAFSYYIAPIATGLVFMALSGTRLFSRSKTPTIKNKIPTSLPTVEPILNTWSEAEKAFMANPATTSLRAIIEAKSEENPQLGPSLGGKEVFQRIFNGMSANGTRRVHVESLL
ncbi:hypothetical protein Q9L58_010951, partial [Maublancomyces gigas]